MSSRTDPYAKLRLVDRHLANLENEQREALEKHTRRFKEKFDKLLLQRAGLAAEINAGGAIAASGADPE